ncbi:MAG TPA: IS110 family transposase, partial [Anaerolineae bacterium]|nr:IS110 family transposase [Anaerolineae bacterium]
LRPKWSVSKNLEVHMATSTVQPVRFMALDMHKHYVMVGAVNKEQEVLLRPKKFTWSEFDRWQAQHVGPGDEIVIEASSNAWHVYDQLSARRAVVHVANPLLVKWIGAAPVKTDPHDTLKLAKLLAAGLLPTVWVPPAPVRALRTLVGQRRRWIKQRTQTRNRLQSLLQGHNLLPPEGDLFAPEQRAWWQTLDLPPGERLLLTQDLLALDQLVPLIDQVETAIQLQSTCEPWASEVPYVLQQTGIGLVTAMTVLAAIGDINRFAHPSQLVGYAGLGARVHESGQTHNTGGITKQGRRELRAAMVEAAWVAVAHNAFWKAKFARYQRRLGNGKAIVAIARQMLVSTWYLWHNRTVDRHSNATAIAHKLWAWAEQGGKPMRHGLTCGHFVRSQLDQLGIGQDLTELRYGSHVYRLPPTAAEANLPAAS